MASESSYKVIAVLMAVLGILPLVSRGQEASFVARYAYLNFQPAVRTVLAGNTFTVNLMIGTGPVDAGRMGGAFSINAVEITVRFPKDLLEVAKLDKGGSILKLWVRDPYAEDGVIRLTGGLPSPGHIGTGKLLTILFRARKEGVARVTIDGGASTVLANDGKGTNVLGEWGEAVYTIKPRPLANQESPPPSPNTPATPAPVSPKLPSPSRMPATSTKPLSRPVILQYPRVMLERRQLTIAGSGPANSTVMVAITASGKTVATVPLYADGQGRWRYTPSEPLRRGSYTVTVYAQDKEGEKSAASSVNVRVLPFVRFYQKEIVPLAAVGIFLPYLFLIRRRKRKKEK